MCMAPIFRDVRADFFKSWSKEMAYVLGYFAADGAMIKNKRGAHFIEFHSTDKELIVSVRRVLHSDHKIGVRKPKEDAHPIPAERRERCDGERRARLEDGISFIPSHEPDAAAARDRHVYAPRSPARQTA